MNLEVEIDFYLFVYKQAPVRQPIYDTKVLFYLLVMNKTNQGNLVIVASNGR